MRKVELNLPLPVLAMQTFPRVWGALLPLRWYIQVLFDQASRGAALRYTAEPFAILAASPRFSPCWSGCASARWSGMG